MNYRDLWPAIQKDILGVIEADPFLGARRCVLVEPGDAESGVSQKLALAVGAGRDGKNGVGCLVLPIERAEDDNVSVPGGPLKLTIVVRWVENVLLNHSDTGTRTPIRVYAAWTEKVLKLYTPVGLTQSLVPSRPAIAECTEDARKNLRVGAVAFTAVEADFRPFLRANRPQLTVSGAAEIEAEGHYRLSGPTTVTVAAEEGATIFFTTDDSHPHEGNAAAGRYEEPVTIREACLFRARAFVTGKAGSDTAAVEFCS